MRNKTSSLKVIVFQIMTIIAFLAFCSPALGAQSDLEKESDTKTARAELAIGQTINGITIGIETCVLLNCDNIRARVGSVLAGSAAGLGGSLLLTRGGIRPGQTQLVDSGSLWGGYNAFMISEIADLERGQQTTAGVVLSGQAAGLGIGTGLALSTGIDSGDVALANTGGIWSSVITALMMAANRDFENGDVTLLAAADVGIVAGGIVANYSPMSRGRTYLLDAGGILGTGTGLFTGMILTEDGISSPATPFMGAVGAAAGLGISAYVTRDWDAPKDSESSSGNVAVMPTEDGGKIAYTLRF